MKGGGNVDPIPNDTPAEQVIIKQPVHIEGEQRLELSDLKQLSFKDYSCPNSLKAVEPTHDQILADIPTDRYSEDCRERISIALMESLSNAVQHSRSGSSVHIRLLMFPTHDTNTCTLFIENSLAKGQHLPDPASLPALSEGNLNDRGRGWWMIRACTDGSVIDPLDHHRVVMVMTFLDPRPTQDP